jgi:hypothetical protein
MMNVATGMTLTEATNAGAFDYHGKARRQQGVPIWSLSCMDG